MSSHLTRSSTPLLAFCSNRAAVLCNCGDSQYPYWPARVLGRREALSHHNLSRNDIADLRARRTTGAAVYFFGDNSVGLLPVECLEPHTADRSKIIRDNWIWRTAQSDARAAGRRPYPQIMRDRYNTAFDLSCGYAERELPRPLPSLAVCKGGRAEGAPAACGTLPAGALLWCTLINQPVWPVRCVSVTDSKYREMREAARADGRLDATEPVKFFGEDHHKVEQEPMLVELADLSMFLPVEGMDGRNFWLEHMRLRSIASAQVRGEDTNWGAEMWEDWEMGCEMAQDCARLGSLEPLRQWLAPPGEARAARAETRRSPAPLIQPPRVESMRIGGVGGIGTLVPASEDEWEMEDASASAGGDASSAEGGAASLGGDDSWGGSEAGSLSSTGSLSSGGKSPRTKRKAKDVECNGSRKRKSRGEDPQAQDSAKERLLAVEPATLPGASRTTRKPGKKTKASAHQSRDAGNNKRAKASATAAQTPGRKPPPQFLPYEVTIMEGTVPFVETALPGVPMVQPDGPASASATPKSKSAAKKSLTTKKASASKTPVAKKASAGKKVPTGKKAAQASASREASTPKTPRTPKKLAKTSQARRMSLPTPRKAKSSAKTTSQLGGRIAKRSPRIRKSSLRARHQTSPQFSSSGVTIVISDSDEDEDGDAAMPDRAAALPSPVKRAAVASPARRAAVTSPAKGAAVTSPAKRAAARTTPAEVGVADVPPMRLSSSEVDESFVPPDAAGGRAGRSRAAARAGRDKTADNAGPDKAVGPVVMSEEHGIMDIYSEFGC